METHARYLLVGLFSLVVAIGLIVFVLWLGKLQLDREYREYDVRFHESVTGLSVGGLVQYHGIQVGEVRRLTLDPKDPREVHVRIRVGADTPIKADTRAQLSYTGLTGVAVVEMFGGSPESKLLYEVDTRDVPEIDTVPSTLSELMSGGSGAMHSAQEVMTRIAEVLSDTNIKRVSATLDHLAEVSGKLREDYPEARLALQDLRTLEQKLTTAADRTNALLAEVQSGIAGNTKDDPNMMADLRTTIEQIQEAALSLKRVSDTGDRTLNGLDAQARGELTETLRALRETSENLARITRDFDRAPAGYLLHGDPLPTYQAKPESRQ
ncbi:hypothetical protein C7S18_03685 [Ahniella affigens]|uniref:Mce/MlaD domain-containing protein n=1 Tax=Ahniella affigens TaxID=2021234 RepID=A0A2P1PNF2_9GAMM|nr:MlaD family protein [Ahniella affigens]AVP96345.1 hypothetical protein C7S18_03685 [Ahniella affigens]